GVCLGGGLEFALACDVRVAIDDPATRIGLPETQLGILPGWGGTQRLTRLIGATHALQLILQGTRIKPDRALKIGLVDEMIAADSLEQKLGEYRQGTVQKADKARSWADWFINQTAPGRYLLFQSARKKTARLSTHYPALDRAIEAVRRAATSDASGYQYEQESIATLIFTPTSQNLVRLFLLQEQARNLKTWVLNAEEVSPVNAIGILGGGTMGAGIAQLALRNGLHVTVKEVDQNAAQAGRQRIESIYQELLRRKSVSPQQMQEQLERLTMTTDLSGLAEMDLIIEAVPESLPLKQKIFADLAETLPPTTLLATNTSALSVNQIFEQVYPRDRVGGLHFFNPVHRMDLVEVVQAAETSPETLEKLLQLTRKLGKTPVVTADAPGFVVNRILMPYLDEAVKLAIEMTARNGDLSVIDREMKKFGMPMGPLELIDQVGVDVAAHVAGSLSIVFGDESITATVLQRMVEGNRLGKKSEAGFYNYVHGKKTTAIGLQPLLDGIDVELDEPQDVPLSGEFSLIQLRLSMAMVNEAGRCLDERVVPEAWMIDMAMVLGTGFAPFRGGPIRFAQSLNREQLIETLHQLARCYGPRFLPSPSLIHLEQS
ncbi:MAG: enoyl-CoA hydratase/isomerase family protein, partial [Planctomycetaceae bacterium]|nr:enoyl-CoA hydratase/isomerase family protein [Planctomycetaceae bacterium]